MNTYLIALIVGLSCFLNACSHSVNNSKPLPTHTSQVEQLATLVAGSQFLKENCQQQQIPTLSKQVKVALIEANKKGWHNIVADEVESKALIILKELNQDNSPLNDKCNYFNQSLSHFIQQMPK